MGRLEELTNDLKTICENGRNTRDDWMLFFLTHINVSLATIADCLSEKDKQDKGGKTE